MAAGTCPSGRPQGPSPSASPPCWTATQRVTYPRVASPSLQGAPLCPMRWGPLTVAQRLCGPIATTHLTAVGMFTHGCTCWSTQPSILLPAWLALPPSGAHHHAQSWTPVNPWCPPACPAPGAPACDKCLIWELGSFSEGHPPASVSRPMGSWAPCSGTRSPWEAPRAPHLPCPSGPWRGVLCLPGLKNVKDQIFSHQGLPWQPGRVCLKA